MSEENEASIARLREVLKGDDGVHRVWGADLRVLMTQRDEAATRAEVAEARLADLSGLTRAELVAREENKRRNLLGALEHLTGLFSALHPNAAEWGDYQFARSAIAAARGDR